MMNAQFHGLLLQAVNALKKCKDKVVLLVAKAEIAYTSSPTMGQIPPLSAGHFSLPNRYNTQKLQMFVALFFFLPTEFHSAMYE